MAGVKSVQSLACIAHPGVARPKIYVRRDVLTTLQVKALLEAVRIAFAIKFGWYRVDLYPRPLCLG
jgi:hypothetical protein